MGNVADLHGDYQFKEDHRNSNKKKKGKELRMDAYYYGFDKTGVREIDLILSAVACAGKAHHHTEGWNNKAVVSYSNMIGETPAYWIQNAADKAAEEWNKK